MSIQEIGERGGSVIPRNGGSVSEAFRQTPLQQIAQQMERLTYKDMIEWARDLHSAGETIGKQPIDIADALHDWAARKLDQQPSTSSDTYK